MKYISFLTLFLIVFSVGASSQYLETGKLFAPHVYPTIIWNERGNLDTTFGLQGKVTSQIPAASLSDGQLAYLAFVALTQLPTERSVLCIDEVELHLHPKMLSQVLYLLEVVAERVPVVVTTHSRRLLDLLSDPASSVAILDFDSQRWRTELRRFDAEALSDWLKDYDGLGKILDAGYQESFLSNPAP